MNLTIKVRLVGSLVALGIGMVAIGTSGLISTAIGNQRLKSVVADRVVPMKQLKAVSDLYAVSIVDAVHKVRSGAFTSAEGLKQVEAAKAGIDKNWLAYRATKMAGNEQALVDKVQADLPAADKALDKLEALLKAGDQPGVAQFAEREMYPVIDPVTTNVGALVDLQIDVAREESAAATQAANISMAVMAGIAVIVGLLLAFATRVVIVQVTRPLLAMGHAMKKLADGDNSVEIPGADRTDELGQMAGAVAIFKDSAIAKLTADAEVAEAKVRADRERQAAGEAAIAKEQAFVVGVFGRAMEQLAAGDLTYRVNEELPGPYVKLSDDFNGALSSLAETMIQVLTGTDGMRTGTEEIAQASDDLSRRTEQQAASLEETAAALDEITATVKTTASGAKQASETVTRTKTEAVRSGEVVAKAVEAMGQIEKSAQQISQIIGVIDEIAFQTNLLALNAGVEAARAGDAGRGFAVVAQEVRALAQRSAEAAKQIKALISTSTQQVGEGVDLVGETGKALQQIVIQVGEIDVLISSIAASAQEQATGLAEVNVAVNQMDQVVQQNAAMVEQSTAAAHSLKSETSELSRLMSRFQTGTAEVSGRSSAPAPRASAPARPAPAPASAHSRPAPSPARAMTRKIAATFGANALKPADDDGWEEF